MPQGFLSVYDIAHSGKNHSGVIILPLCLFHPQKVLFSRLFPSLLEVRNTPYRITAAKRSPCPVHGLDAAWV